MVSCDIVGQMTALVKLGPIGWAARLLVYTAIFYWALYAAVAPLTNVDAQMYNLARLHVAEGGGLFGNPLFTSPFQIMWPWSFDAVHLPFLHLRYAYSIPSFCCMLGICYVVHSMVTAAFGLEAAWVAVLSLFGLTCLVYQATSAKNDIAIVFAAAVWIYARWKYRSEGKGYHLGWMVLAIGFMAGAKTTGVVYGVILSLWMVYELRTNTIFLMRVCWGLSLSVILFGSIETYIESYRVFGHALGPPEIVDPLKNQDGFKGGLANIFRYLMGGVYTGPSVMPPNFAEPGVLVRFAKGFLRVSGLFGAGLEPHVSDNLLFFFQSGYEEFSGFGPLGTCAVGAMVLALFYWKPIAPWWQLAATAFAGICIVSYFTAYTQWSNRYLIGWYALATVGCVCFLWSRETKTRVTLRWVFLLVAAFSTVAAPMLSFNRGPSAIVASVRDRDRFETCVAPLVGRIRERLRILRARTPGCHVCVIASRGSAVLPYLEDRQLEALVVSPKWFARLIETGRLQPGDLIVDDCRTDCPLFEEVEVVSSPDFFGQSGTRSQPIYTIKSRAESPPHKE